MLINRLIMKFFLPLVSLVMIVSLTGCYDSNLKKEPAVATSEKFIPDGHLVESPKIGSIQGSRSRIPDLANNSLPKLPSFRGESTSHYSITAVNVPVKELLFQVAQDAGKQIDLYSDIEGNITINALNQPLEDILERIAEQAGLMFVIENNTIKVKPDLPEWRNYKVDYVNINKVSEDSIDMRMSVSGSSGGGVKTKKSGGSFSKVTVKSEHDFWQTLEDNVKLLAQIETKKKGDTLGFDKNTVINPEAGVISIYTSAKKHKIIEEYIQDVTTRVDRQVLIEATVVEVILNDEYQAGIDWSVLGEKAFGDNGGVSISSPFAGPASGFSVATMNSVAGGGFMTGDWNILANLRLLKTFGESKVLSSPKIMAINNQTALLKVVNNLVYFTVDVNITAATAAGAGLTTYESTIHTVPVGFTMSVTPFVSADGDITLNVRPTISRQIGTAIDPNPALKDAGVESVIPVIQEKEMSSVLRLKDRQTAVIGGLIEDQKLHDNVGVPWLSDVPILGSLFGSRKDQTQKTELVIFIRPTIIKNPDISNGDLQHVGRFLRTHSNDEEK